MTRSLQRPLRLLLLGLGIALAGVGVLGLTHGVKSGHSAWSWNSIRQAVSNPRLTYARWRLNRETRVVQTLIRKADVVLVAEGDRFTRSKPLGPDDRPVEAIGKDLLPSCVMPSPGTCGREAIAVRILSSWGMRPGTKNPSGTDMEDFALDVATKVKACGFRRITVYGSVYGDYWRIFDGEVPSREAIYAQVRRLEAMMAGL